MLIRSFKALLTWAVAAAALLFVSLGIVLLVFLYDPSRFVPLIERQASAYLDRQVQLGELAAVSLGRESYVLARDISIANAPWAGAGELGRVERFELRLDSASLWRKGPIVVTALELDGLMLDLEAREGLAPNWVLFPDRPTDQAAAEFSLPLVFKHVVVADSRTRYRTPRQDVLAELSLLSLALQEEGVYTDLEIQGVVNDMPLRGGGFIGPEAALRDGRNLVVDLEMALGLMTIEAKGQVEDLGSLSGADFALDIASPRSRKILDLLGLSEVRDGSLHFSGRLAQAPTGITLNATGSMADFDLKVEGKILQPAQADGVDLRFHLDGPSMLEAGALFGYQGLKDIPYELSGRVLRDGSLLQLEDGLVLAGRGMTRLSGKLPYYPSIDEWEANIEGREMDLSTLGTLLGVDGLPERYCDIDGQLSADDDGIELVELSIQSLDLELTLNGIVGELPDFQATALHARFAGEDLSALQRILGTEKLPSKPFVMSGSLTRHDEFWRLENGLISLSQHQLQLAGKLDRLVDPGSIDGSVQFNSDDLAATLAEYGVDSELPKGVSLRIGTAIERDNSGFRLSDLQGDFAGVVFQGGGLVSNAQDWAESRVELEARGESLRDSLVNWTHFQVPDEPYRLAADVTYHAPLVSIDRLALQLGAHNLAAELELVEVAGKPAKVKGKARFWGANFKQLLGWAGFDTDVEEQGYELVTGLRADASKLELQDIRFSGEQSDIKGEMQLVYGEVPRLDLNLRSDQLYLPALLLEPEELMAEQEKQQEKQKQTGARPGALSPPTKEQLTHRVIPDTPLPTQWINHLNGRWQYTVDQLVQRDGLGGNLLLDVELADGVLQTKTLKWDGAASQGSAEIRVDASDTVNEINFDLASDQIPLLWMLTGKELPNRKAVYLLSLDGRGASVRELVGSLDGALVTRGKGARLNNRGLDLALGDILGTAQDMLNPYSETEKTTVVDCHAAGVHVKDGVVSLNPGGVIRTDKIDLLITGLVDLKTESLNVDFKSRARKGIGISAGKVITPYVKLAGNMAHPHLTVDPEAVVRSGGIVLATGGLSILAEGLWDRWVVTSENPCDALAKEARENKRTRRLFEQEFGEALEFEHNAQ